MTFGTRKHPQYRKPLPSTSAPQATRTIPPKTLSLKFAQKSGSGVFRTSRACACAREAMRPFLNNGTTFTTCKPIAPQRPHPSEQAPKTPRNARVKIELEARSRAKPASLLTRPSLARVRARTELCGFCGSDKKRHARACARGLSAKLYRLRRFPAYLSTFSKRRR